MKLNTFARVRELQDWRAVAFAATLIERSLPNYLLFCELCEFGDPAQYRKTLDAVWAWLADPKQKLNLSVHLEKIEVATPDTADFDNYGVYPAVDLCMSMAALLQLMMGDDPQGAVVVSKLSQGSVEAYIDASSEEELDAKAIKDHPLMQWEVAFQNELLDRVTEAKRGPELTAALKQMALEEGISNIGLEIQ
ncbi:YjaG family protein [Aliiglaciecola sp. CAU 1673]|uniref:YjaG family protein n=1 Tax=Aliiglaciecola sp. CAU 1673 TaxID=3032595 RepID=UPI0023DB2E4A|nr:YjaG family protein [Aliiglaciecola sp. CAU 1673]MDF2177814.1 YjaG family protein [Aliiglaciecola sp. CAU 1673]